MLLSDTASHGLMIRLTSAPGKEAEVERLIRRCLVLAQEEPETISWYGVRLDWGTFGIFSTFENDAGLERHLSGHLQMVLEAAGSEILAGPSLVEKIEIIEAKI